MKPRIVNSMKASAAVLSLASLLTITACSSNQESSSKEKVQESKSQTSPKPPGVDIHTATFMENIQAIKQHINAGSDLNKRDAYGSTPLNTACVFGKTEVALLLIEGGADVNLKTNDGSLPLNNAAFFCRTEIVKALLENGADKTLRNGYGSTALESVAGPFSEVKPIYEQISKDLGPLGLKLDYKYLEKTRPVIAEMLK